MFSNEFNKNCIGNYICIKWHIEDVQNVRPDLTDKQAAKVLEKVAETHNAEIGINWEVIRTIADMEYPTIDIEQ
ncbi:MAG: hypothetical protein QXN55_09195 [Candidatus Nitrosotenuis sp.]